ncbi:MAG: HesA/MoeB/ThiF family protein [Dehalococcoidia bacterium]|nr:HesA/MoeB/ThiF family protein [Dehalococcoidia bacterium]
MLSDREKERYDRQMMLPNFGPGGQEKLKRSRILVAGVGGLGCPACAYLSAAGVGNIRIVDNDRIDMSNLNRQILHWDKDVGRMKVDSAAEKLTELNRDVKIEAIAETITEDNVAHLSADCDAILDAMDNIPARLILNREAIRRKIPFFHGGIYGMEGCAMTVIPGSSACVRCINPDPIPTKNKFPVIGVAPALIAIIQVTEVLKFLVGMGELLTNRLLVYDGFAMCFSEIAVRQNPDCDHCGPHAK